MGDTFKGGHRLLLDFADGAKLLVFRPLLLDLGPWYRSGAAEVRRRAPLSCVIWDT